MPTLAYQRLLILLLALTLAVTAVFTAFPQLDIAFSALFYQNGFWLHELKWLEVIRQILIKFMYLLGIGILIMFFVNLARRKPVRALGYAGSVILVGPLLLVNAILKNNWGRARPVHITEFGGDKVFSPAYYFSDQCSTNCSFTSGEGSGIAVAAFLLGFLAWPKVPKKYRRALVVALTLLVFVGAGLRIVTGQHFLSDTLLSILFSGLVAALLYRLFYPDNRA